MNIKILNKYFGILLVPIIFFVFCIFFTPKVSAAIDPINCLENNSSNTHNPKVLVLDFNPNISVNNSTVDLRTYMRTIDTRTYPVGSTGLRDRGWTDSSGIANELKKVITDVSDHMVNYQVVGTQTISNISGIGLDNGIYGKSDYSQYKFFKCWELGNDPQTNSLPTLTNKLTESKSGPYETASTLSTYPTGTNLVASCKSTSTVSGVSTVWIAHKITTVVNGKSTVIIEYVLKSSLDSIPNDFPDCDLCKSDVDIVKLATDYDLCGKANRGEIDEVWFVGPRYAIRNAYGGGIESALVSPFKDMDLRASHGNFRLDLCNNPLPITIGNYEQGEYSTANYAFMHYLGHRMEYFLDNYQKYRSVYNRVDGSLSVDWTKYNNAIPSFGNLNPDFTANRFSIESKWWWNGILNQNIDGCGTTHSDPLSPADYLHGQSGTTKSTCFNPLTNSGFNLTGIKSSQVISSESSDYTCDLWGCTSEGWQKYWFDKIPINAGASKEMSNDWWVYFLNPETAKIRYPETPACTCDVGYFYDSNTSKCELNSCNNSATNCTIQNIPGKPVCNTTNGSCVECTSSSHCPVSKSMCLSNVCTQCKGSIVNGNCVSCFNFDNSKPNYNESTYRCEACPVSTTWNGVSCVAKGCVGNSSICSGTTPICDTTNNLCVECLSDNACGSGAHCVNGSCSMCSSATPIAQDSSILCSSSLPSIYSPCPQNPNDTVNIGGTNFPVYQMPHCKVCPAGSTDPLCANNCNLATQDRVFDAQKNIYRCVEKECSDGIKCSNNATEKWCSQGKCKECPTGANFDEASNSCVYCANDEIWEAGKCVDRTCANGGITCGGNTPVCNTTDNYYLYANKCVQCNQNSDCASNICDTSNHVCKTCASGQHFNTITNSCVSCPAFSAFDPTRTYIWDPVNNSCVAKQSCGTTYCQSASEPYCNTSNNTCNECVSNLDCTDNSDGSYDPNEPYCDMGKCSRCPTSAPNYNVYTKQCVGACTTSQVWNGRNCVDSITQSDQFTYLCGADSQSLSRYENTIPIPLKYGFSESVCPTEKPYCVRTLRSQAAATYNNFEFSSNRTIPSCAECILNIDCPSDSPQCIGGRCTPCSPDNPLYDIDTKSCTKCPVGSKYDRSTNSCLSCPMGQILNEITNQCVVPSCINGLVKCDASAPICSSNGTCVMCENSSQCGGATPACQNNVCVHCEMYDQQTGLCFPNTGIPNADIQIWDNNSYNQLSCNNGGLKCDLVSKQCDPATNSCVDCLNDTNCKDPTLPVCDVSTKTCTACPSNMPYYGISYEFDEGYFEFLASSAIQSPIVNTISSISKNGGVIVDPVELAHTQVKCQACPDNSVWDGTKCIIKNCANGVISCESGQVCQVTEAKCVQCNSNSDCNTEFPSCVSNSCKKCPSSTPFFDSITSTCKSCSEGLYWYNGSCISEVSLDISGVVKLDKNYNSIPDESIDLGLSNVGMNLNGITVDGIQISKSITTNIDGKFAFEDIHPGIYSVTQIQPTEYMDSSEFGTSDEQLVEDNEISNIALFENSTDQFVFLESGWNISGTVYADLQRNGEFDLTDYGIKGTTVKLSGEEIEQEVVTDLNGEYKFNNLLNGVYQISIVNPLGYNLGSENESNIKKLTIDSNSQVVNFGKNLVHLSAKTILDYDNSKSFSTADIPIKGNEIQLLGIDIFGNNVSRILKTDNSGEAKFENLIKGTYELKQVQPNTTRDSQEIMGTTPSMVENDRFFEISLNNDSSEYLFLESGWVVRGKVFADRNKNTFYQENEIGISEVGVTLETISSGNPYESNVLGISSININTDINGDYIFENVPNGIYRIIENQPSEYITNSPNVLNISLNSSDSLENNFSELSGTISGSIYLDANQNGIKEQSEKGRPNFPIILINKITNKRIFDFRTDSLGNFEFHSLPASSYTISIPLMDYKMAFTLEPAEEIKGVNISNKLKLANTGSSFNFLTQFFR